MAFYDKFPYTNFQEINLDRLIQELIKVKEGLDFVIENASLKYADPIQWNITHQYQANTVVIDPATGIAYISTKPVPDNVQITDTGYWTPIFDLGALFDDLEQEITDEQTARENADTALAGDILAEQTARENADTALGNDILAEQTARENADIALNTRINGLLDDLINVYDVKKHGAAGDGVTDDTQVFKDAVQSGLTVFIPHGMYRLTDTLEIGSFVKIIGVGTYGLNKTSPQGGSVLNFENVNDGIKTTYGAQSCYIANLTVTRTGSTPAQGAGIDIEPGSLHRIYNVEAYDFFNGFLLQNVGLAWISDCYAHDNFSDGFHFENVNISGALQWQVFKCFAQENNNNGFSVIGKANVANHVTLGMFDQCYTFNNGNSGFMVLGSANGGVNGVRINNGFFGNDNKNGIYINSMGTFGGFITGTVVEACGTSASGRGQSIAPNNTAYGIFLAEQGGNWEVTGCKIKQCTSYGVYCRADNQTIANCDIQNNSTADSTVAGANILQVFGNTIISNNVIKGTAQTGIYYSSEASHILSGNNITSTNVGFYSYRTGTGTDNIIKAANALTGN